MSAGLQHISELMGKVAIAENCALPDHKVIRSLQESRSKLADSVFDLGLMGMVTISESWTFPDNKVIRTSARIKDSQHTDSVGGSHLGWYYTYKFNESESDSHFSRNHAPRLMNQFLIRN